MLISAILNATFWHFKGHIIDVVNTTHFSMFIGYIHTIFKQSTLFKFLNFLFVQEGRKFERRPISNPSRMMMERFRKVQQIHQVTINYKNYNL